MNVCFTSYRAFTDGKAEQPFLESDPANIAYALRGSYFSFFTLRNLSEHELKKLFEPYDLVIVALDVQAIELVARIIASSDSRVATYSEGHIADYQRLSPTGQVLFLKAIRAATINFLYWEKYVPFYRALTHRPVEYLPYPYLLTEARRNYIPISQRESLVAIPSGFAGATRNGLATLVVAKRLMDSSVVDRMACWLEAESFEEDYQAISHFLFLTPISPFSPAKFNWRRWLTTSHVDYRVLLKLRASFGKPGSSARASAAVQIRNLSLYRRTGWANYLAQLAQARLMIDLNNRETVGRNAMDCAALGIPYVSVDRSDMQPRLFPQTMLNDSWNIDAAYSLCQRLLHDAVFYHQVVDYATDAIKQFDIASFRQRFESALRRLSANDN